MRCVFLGVLDLRWVSLWCAMTCHDTFSTDFCHDTFNTAPLFINTLVLCVFRQPCFTSRRWCGMPWTSAEASTQITYWPPPTPSTKPTRWSTETPPWESSRSNSTGKKKIFHHHETFSKTLPFSRCSIVLWYIVMLWQPVMILCSDDNIDYLTWL